MAPSDHRRLLLYGLGPLALLAVFVVLFLRHGPLGIFEAAFPPVEKLTVERVVLRDGEVVLHVTNGGPEPVTVAQVLMDDAYWQHTITPDRTIPRLGRATIVVPYPWVEGEPVAIKLLTSTGLTIEHEVPVAVASPAPDARYLATFTLLGTYVGVVPVFVGLLWFPFLRRMGRRWTNFFLSLTGGLLVFLGVDALEEALELRAGVPEALQGTALVTLGALGTLLGLTLVVRRTTRAAGDDATGRLVLAYLIALGIGLHNLGEGLAIGAAYAVGEIRLGTFLVLGFMLHNTTEGLGIVAPIARDRPAMMHLASMGMLAGAPTILGAWLGGFTYSPVAATLFLAIGAGAIFQVVYELGRLMVRQAGEELMTATNFAGFAVGLAVMYLTGLFVA
ncbi:MAG: metal transporter [Armatimonadota bacterium]|nr:metal transporter [Armatimonadota bacterium]MDR7532186.1 metal transporter [Armatimonadota bacterium]MDR7537279.1 metal transporter [Armatimonadota bacterium]